MNRIVTLATVALAWGILFGARTDAAELLAGTGKAEITDREAGPVNDPLFVKALVLKQGEVAAVLVTVDAVAIGEIGRIRNSFLADVRSQIANELPIDPRHILVNASHCHGVVANDVEGKTIEAVRAAWKSLTPVRVAVGVGHEDRIMENRRLTLADGRQADVRRAYSMPRDEDVAAIGPADPEIGLLRLDRLDGRTLAVVYNFACHPIMGVPSGGNTADFPGFASRAIEESLGDGATALFVQGCAGDVNPVRYKSVHEPHDAEPLGNMLGLAVLRELKKLRPIDDAQLRVVNEMLALPRAKDFAQRIAAAEAERDRLVGSLKSTSLNFKTFVPLYVQYKLSDEHPAYYSHRYLREQAIGRDDLAKLDAENRANLEAYLRNIEAMEELTRVQTNLALLKKHEAQTKAAGGETLDVEVAGLRVGDFYLVTFPGELTAQIGLNIKERATKPHTFVAGYTNGYIYYTATETQRRNTGYAQEDCDVLLAPEWQALFEDKVSKVLIRLD